MVINIMALTRTTLRIDALSHEHIFRILLISLCPDRQRRRGDGMSLALRMPYAACCLRYSASNLCLSAPVA